MFSNVDPVLRREYSWALAIHRALLKTDMDLIKRSNLRNNIGMTPSMALAKQLLADPFLFEDEEKYNGR